MQRNIIIITILLLTSLSVSNAQFRFKPEDRLKDLVEKLKLDKDQTTKVEIVLKKAGDQLNNLSDDRTERREKVRSIMDESNKEIEKILNKNQKKEFQKMLEERKKRMSENRRRQN
ncbi:MAG: hypothetical protein NTX22_00985 [Ignavibacteriales bacterium]|nr:hypothetical protein [Ignavibacteriales bacterium]